LFAARDRLKTKLWVVDNMVNASKPEAIDYFRRAGETDFTEFKKRVWEMSDAEYYSIYDEVFSELGFFDYTQTNLKYFRGWMYGDVLDVGCAGGGLLQALRDGGYDGRLIGVDISKVALNEATRRGLEVVWGDVEKRLPFPDRSFDTVVCGHTLEHLRHPGEAFSELKRVCRGALIVLIPLQGEDQRWKKTNTHLQFWPTIESFEGFAGVKAAESMVERDRTLGILLFKLGL